MDDQDRPHHKMEMVMLHIEAHETPCASRPPVPTSPIYPMEQLEARLYVKPAMKRTTKVKKGSLFSKGPRRGLDNDPFLNRMARLH